MSSPDADMSKTIENLYNCKHYYSSLYQSPIENVPMYTNSRK